jgi:TonB family protein
MILLVVALLLVPTTLAGPQSRSAGDDWSRLLAAFVDHNEPAKALVDTMAQRSSEVAVRNLAAVLMQEWDLPRESDSLRHPRSVYVPKLEPRTEQASAEAFVLRVTISKDGHVTNASFVKSSQQTRLAREVLDKVNGALFRPAYQKGRFVTGESIVKYTVEVE